VVIYQSSIHSEREEAFLQINNHTKHMINARQESLHFAFLYGS